jgi:hypothetical protein
VKPNGWINMLTAIYIAAKRPLTQSVLIFILLFSP